MQISGIGVFGALAILGEFGEITHFAKAKELCAYVRLVSSLHRSGQKNSSGLITKAGRSRLRWVMVEDAHASRRHEHQFGRLFHRPRPRKETDLAIVATARKMLVIIWHLPSEDGFYRARKVEKVTHKFLERDWALSARRRRSSAPSPRSVARASESQVPWSGVEFRKGPRLHISRSRGSRLS